MIKHRWSIMKAHFQSMNPSQTDDSFLLRFEDPLESTTRCILVDCGEGVDVDEFLGDDDELVGMVITHAHEDHISALPENAREGIPIFTTPNTATIIRTIFNEAANVGSADALDDTDTWPFWKRITPNVAETVTDALTPITEFTQVTPHVDIAPVPAGHAPGAASFLFKLIGGESTRYMLATGDFTTHAVGTNPGLTTDIARAVNVDAVFLNSPTRPDDEYGNVLSESLGSMLKHAMQGKKVLVPASSLTGIHYAHWAGKLVESSSIPVKITLAGLTAKLYKELGYDASQVNLVPEYRASDVIDNGNIVITAPEVPTSGGAGEIYNHVKNDPNATVIQLKSGGDKPSSHLSIDESYRFLPHPTDEEIDNLIESLNPVHMVVNHGPKDNFKDRYSFTIHWTIKDHHRINTFLNKGKWVEPSWMSSTSARSTRSENGSRGQLMPEPSGESALPSVMDTTTAFEEARIFDADIPGFLDTTPVPENTESEVEAETDAPGNSDSNSDDQADAAVTSGPIEGSAADSESVESQASGTTQQSQTVETTGARDGDTVAVVSGSSPTAAPDTPHVTSAEERAEDTPDAPVTASDGGAAAALSDPDAFSELPEDTSAALVETLQDVRAALDTQIPPGTVVNIDSGTVTIEIETDATDLIEEGDDVTLSLLD